MDDLLNRIKEITGMDEAKVEKMLNESNEDRKRFLSAITEMDRDSKTYQAVLDLDKSLLIELINGTIAGDLSLLSHLDSLMPAIRVAYSLGYRRGKM